jgi:hypothetical protein
MTAASASRSSVAPGVPVTGNSRTASAAPACNDVHDPSTSSAAVPDQPAVRPPGAEPAGAPGAAGGPEAAGAEAGVAVAVTGAACQYARFYTHRCAIVSSSECF